MEISFATPRLEKLCNSAKELRGKLGPNCARRLRLRLDEMAAADCLDDLRKLPQTRCHELTGNLKGQLAVDLEHPKRLLFEPDHEPQPSKPDGGLDWQQVTKVRILSIEDYH